MFVYAYPNTKKINFQSRQQPEKTQKNNKQGCRDLLLTSLIALASLSPINSNSANNYRQNSGADVVTVLDNELSDDNPTAEYVNDNNILEPSDFVFSTSDARITADSYLKGLKPYWNKKSTQAVDDMANSLVYMFNKSNSIVYDFITEKPVKDADAKIKYRKDGKIASAVLTDAQTGEVIYDVKYKYDKQGNIESVTYNDVKTIEYRKDGSRFSLRVTNYDTDLLCSYNQSGKIISKTIKDKDSYVFIKYDGNDNVISEFRKNSEGASFKVYNQEQLMFYTVYDKDDKVKTYTDNYFKSSLQNRIEVPSAYFNKTVNIIKASENNDAVYYPKFYKTEYIDGKIIKPVRQGTSGTCYISGIVNSMVRTPIGRKILDAALDPDIYNDRIQVNLKGLDRSYIYNNDYIYKNISRLGRKDGDYSALVKAYEDFRLEDLTKEEQDKLPSEFFNRNKYTGKMVDSGYPTEFFYALTGKYMYQSGDKITNNDLKIASKFLKSGNGIVNAGTMCEETKDCEIPWTDQKLGITPVHNLSVTDIDVDRGYISFYDAVTENEIKNYPINKFKKYFSKLYYAELQQDVKN